MARRNRRVSVTHLKFSCRPWQWLMDRSSWRHTQTYTILNQHQLIKELVLTVNYTLDSINSLLLVILYGYEYSDTTYRQFFKWKFEHGLKGTENSTLKWVNTHRYFIWTKMFSFGRTRLVLTCRSLPQSPSSECCSWHFDVAAKFFYNTGKIRLNKVTHPDRLADGHFSTAFDGSWNRPSRCWTHR